MLIDVLHDAYMHKLTWLAELSWDIWFRLAQAVGSSASRVRNDAMDMARLAAAYANASK